MIKRLILLLALAVALVQPGQLTAREPANLNEAKQAVRAYLTSGDYARDVAKVAIKANKYLAKRLAQPLKEGEKRAIVFDIDETTLTNISHISANDFGYVPGIWDRWVAEARAPAIVPVQIAYDVAVRNDVAVFFITGRSLTDAPGTEKNLREVGYATWAKIYYKPADHVGNTRSFKTGIRRQLVADGYTIVANIGDQDSDLGGDFAERDFKLPNPYYRIE